MAKSFFGEQRLEFFHIGSVISQVWRSGSKMERLAASQADDTARATLRLAAAYRSEGRLSDTSKFGNLFGLFCTQLERFDMAPKASRNDDRNNAPEWRGFLEYRLSPEELEDLDSWAPEAAEVLEALHGFIVDGYTFTVSYNPRTAQACFSLRDNQAGRKSAGYCLTTFDADCAAAIKAGVFKQKVILRDSWDALLQAGKPVRRG